MDEEKGEEGEYFVGAGYDAKAKTSMVWEEVFRMLDAEVRKRGVGRCLQDQEGEAAFLVSNPFNRNSL